MKPCTVRPYFPPAVTYSALSDYVLLHSLQVLLPHSSLYIQQWTSLKIQRALQLMCVSARPQFPGPRSPDQCAMALKTARLERKYEQSLLQSMQLLDAERSRAKHVEQLYLEFENHDLRSQLDRASDELIQTTKAAHEARVLLHGACKEVDHLQSIKQSSSHTSDGLHVGHWHPCLVRSMFV